MKNLICRILLILAVSSFATAINAQTSAFTYQGKLSENSTPAQGTYEMQFALFNAAANGDQIGSTITNSNVSVANGSFTLQLDFGAEAFASPNLYLQISVKKPQENDFTPLNPRQPITNVPLAVRAQSAANAEKLGGVAAANYLLSNGDGANVTNLNGANLTPNSVTGAKIADDEVVRSINGLKDNITLAGDGNVSITTSGDTITISTPQPPAEIPVLYGDASAGDLIIEAKTTVNLTDNFAQLTNGGNLQFENVQINGTLIVPSGFVLRATGNVTIGTSGIISVNSEPANFGDYPGRGIARAGASRYKGGIGLSSGQIPSLAKVTLSGGSPGAKLVDNPALSGGEGGGSLAIYAHGNILNQGIIEVNGKSGQVSSGSGLPGVGGGAGGVVVLVAGGTITQDENGVIKANGGNGGNAAPGSTNAIYGGGGGGGGGVVLMISPFAPSVANAANVQVGGGAAGANAGTVGAFNPGGGGGAGGGNGGDGSKPSPPPVVPIASQAGSNGQFQTIVAPKPEKLVF